MHLSSAPNHPSPISISLTHLPVSAPLLLTCWRWALRVAGHYYIMAPILPSNCLVAIGGPSRYLQVEAGVFRLPIGNPRISSSSFYFLRPGYLKVVAAPPRFPPQFTFCDFCFFFFLSPFCLLDNMIPMPHSIIPVAGSMKLSHEGRENWGFYVLR